MFFQLILTIVVLVIVGWFAWSNLLEPAIKSLIKSLKKPEPEKPEKIKNKMEILIENRDRLKNIKDEIVVTEELKEITEELDIESKTLEILDKSLENKEEKKE